jgi:eukaryotic-like serine/threonine-protein kinase
MHDGKTDQSLDLPPISEDSSSLGETLLKPGLSPANPDPLTTSAELSAPVHPSPEAATLGAVPQSFTDAATLAGPPPGDTSSTGGLSAPPVAWPDVPNALPRTFGRYLLQSEIARGGMGVVYRAVQIALNRPVALKMILSGTGASSREIERFELEARAAGGLDHPNIVPVYDFGIENGTPFFSMAFVEGTNFQQLAQDRKLDAVAVVRLMLPVVDAVAHAHAHGIVHRDIKPSNILLNPKGQPRVTDFGLARRFQEEKGLTAAGQILGTPSYMAPEQAQGDVGAVGPNVDIYALGGVLYYLLTGQPPFTGPTTLTILTKLVTEATPPPSRVNPAIPADLEAICLKCLAKKPQDRYTSAQELWDALQAWLQKDGRAAQPNPLAETNISPRPIPGGSTEALPVGDVTPANSVLSPLDQPATTPIRRPVATPAPATVVETGKKRLPVLLIGAPLAVVVGLLIAGAVGLVALWQQRPPTSTEPIFADNIGEPVKKGLRNDFELSVRLTGDWEGPKGVHYLKAGEKLDLIVTPVEGSHVYVITWNPKRPMERTKLFPNSQSRESWVDAGEALLIPGRRSRGASKYNLKLYATANSDPDDILEVIASTEKIANLEVSDNVVMQTDEKRNAAGVEVAELSAPHVRGIDQQIRKRIIGIEQDPEPKAQQNEEHLVGAGARVSVVDIPYRVVEK